MWQYHLKQLRVFYFEIGIWYAYNANAMFSCEKGVSSTQNLCDFLVPKNQKLKNCLVWHYHLEQLRQVYFEICKPHVCNLNAMLVMIKG